MTVNQLGRSLKIAFSMYSSIPVKDFKWKEEDMKYVMDFFPLVGALIGAVTYVLFALTFHFGLGPGNFFLPAIFAVLPVLLSGGIHIDGFIDTVDAMLSHREKDKRLLIMQDPHVGGLGVMGAVIYFLLLAGSFSACYTGQKALTVEAFATAALGFVLSRTMSGMSLVTSESARGTGLAYTFQKYADRKNVRDTLTIEAVVTAILMIGFGRWTGLLALAFNMLFVLFFRRAVKKPMGGITGDTCGFLSSMSELVTVFVAAAFTQIFSLL